MIDIGMVRSPMLYFASGVLNLPGAVITASHSPKDYNGIKLVAPKAVPLTAETGLTAIRNRVTKGEFKDAKKRGGYTKQSFKRQFRTYILKGLKKEIFKGMTVATDIGNGMSGASMASIDDALPAKFPMIFKKPDGRFPNRDSDPCLRKNQKYLIELIKKKQADFGIGFDGDGDRIAFLDEKGNYINCAAIGALLAKRLIEKESGAGIVYTNLTSKILVDTVKASKGKAVRARVGHTFLKERMRATKAVFGAEHSGHFFWRDFFNTDSTILTLLAVMEAYAEAREAGKTFSEMMKPYTVYSQTEDVVVEVSDKKLAMELLIKEVKKMKPKKITLFDGCFVEFDEVWGAIKPSVTEDAIKLMFESKSKAKATSVQKQLLTKLKAIAKKLN
ncbi:hypothetical protein KC723_01780 [Candidatus Kaiserbacteria bacterium]|nr:hypothetical protein [Candidatus Kaiserbacteria bacterium]